MPQPRTEQEQIAAGLMAQVEALRRRDRGDSDPAREPR
jgi:hypothetical protein